MKASLKRLVKYVVIRSGLEAVSLSRAASLWPSAAGRGVIFTLHHVRPDGGAAFSPNALLSVTPAFLEEAIEAALECGLIPVALEDLPSLLADPADKRRFVSFTLDDGYRNNAEHAAPVFRKHGIPYTIFIASGLVERSRSMWWETAERLLRQQQTIEFDFGQGQETVRLGTIAEKLAAYERMAHFVGNCDEDEAVARIDACARDHGIDPLAIVDALVMDAAELRTLCADPLVRLGAHTMTHINMKRVSEARLSEEIAGSAKAVEAYVGRYPRTFAYPYGGTFAVGEREVRAVAEAGFAAAVTTQAGVLKTEDAVNPTGLHRVSLNGLYQQKRFVKALISGLPFKLM